MTQEKKVLGEERRNLLLHWLQTEDKPLTGGELAGRTNVSRQVIVQDISLLKAKNEPILATSQGYVYMKPFGEQVKKERIIVSFHEPHRTKEELYILVDHGVTVKDVRIEHPVYGDLNASVMVSSRAEVDAFIRKIKQTNASYLSQLTDGTHLHTIEADSEEKLDAACAALKEAGMVVE
ncbi:transcription repressor NadR [Sutcliffiella horikoshii]|uniref:Transcription repressor NadR n=1 Tax=Sutcliffiella horikoshii TaxID=79883 RepID=A0A1Y0CR02_9BACI|nr:MULTISPECIES: transcription repressor NadR [Bacillaceae]ART77444.1 transcription repressor NadR [Sutcliffiella horikoshii]MEA3322146.1 transcription repressor NadR [Bacillota bacterium]NMH72746.1 transcription repressor NadR [Bacillus sp. RO2]TYS71238.1 transcription repressor NadR [Sutcliffiella horikoshii]